MRLSQIVAVDHVELEGVPGAVGDLLWLYQDLVGLTLMASESVEPTGPPGTLLRFRSGNIELRYRLRPDPVVEPVACRLTVEVPLLGRIEAVLLERSWPYQRLRGLRRTDRRLSLLDPGGNRIEIKQHWPLWF